MGRFYLKKKSQKYFIGCAYRLLHPPKCSGFSDDLIMKDFYCRLFGGQEAPTNDGDYKREVIYMLVQH